MICENENIEPNDYNYVWQCTKAQAVQGESIPMRKGDFLFICVDKDGAAHFRYRKRDWRAGPETCENTRENAQLWAQATATVDKEKNTISGNLTKDRKFEMSIQRKPDSTGFTIRCHHFVNPPEGDWEGDDDWTPQ